MAAVQTPSLPTPRHTPAPSSEWSRAPSAIGFPCGDPAVPASSEGARGLLCLEPLCPVRAAWGDSRQDSRLEASFSGPRSLRPWASLHSHAQLLPPYLLHSGLLCLIFIFSLILRSVLCRSRCSVLCPRRPQLMSSSICHGRAQCWSSRPCRLLRETVTHTWSRGHT